MRAIPTTGMTTAIAVFAPVSRPPPPPPLPPLLSLSASDAADEDAAAASAEFVDELASVVGSGADVLDAGNVTTTVTGPVLAAPSPPVVGDSVMTEVTSWVVGSADGAVDVSVSAKSVVAGGSLVEASEMTSEDTEEAMEEDTGSSDVEGGIVVWAELEILEVVTAGDAESVEKELMAVVSCRGTEITYQWSLTWRRAGSRLNRVVVRSEFRGYSRAAAGR